MKTAVKRSKQAPISSFFYQKVPRQESLDKNEDRSTDGCLPLQQTSSSSLTVTEPDSTNIEEHNASTSIALCSPTPLKNDIYNFAKKSNISDAERFDILKNLWVPDDTYSFPVSKHFQEKGRNLRFQHKWLSRWKWLAYSAAEDGAYCKYCVAFSKSGAGINSQPLASLCKNKFNNWKKVLHYFEKHSANKYHQNCIHDADCFLSVRENPEKSVENQLVTENLRRAAENRNKLIPIIETIILCGRQELALRGNRDHGKISCSDLPDHNEGNFRALLRYRANVDTELRTVLEGPGKRDKYTSPTIQNEIIEACNTIILNKLVEKVNKSKCFSVLLDETADISGVEQASLCARYVDFDSKVLREDFLQFLPVTDLTGRGLASLMLQSLTNFGIECQYLRGQGYDGASSMSGKLKGTQAIVKEQHPTALYVHCSAHSLNLAVSKSCEVQAIRNCLGIVGASHNFFKYPKRRAVLLQCIEKCSVQPAAKSLKSLCATRWIERFDAVADFTELLEPLVEALTTISGWPKDSSDTSKEANSLLCSILQCDFIISLFVTAKVFGLGRTLSKVLQKPTLCLKEAMRVAGDTRQELEVLRADATPTFQTLFQTAKDICQKLDITISLPRLAATQRNRLNYMTNCPEEYYRRAVYIPFLDSFITELSCKFSEHRKVLSGFSALFPSGTSDVLMKGEELEDFRSLVAFYISDMEGGVEDVTAELQLWRRKCVKLNPRPSCAMSGLSICDKDMYPNIATLLQILATLPVSTSTPERSFSTLKRIKTYLRNTTRQARLNGLALLSVHRLEPVTPLQVLEELAKKKKKLDMSL